MIDIIKRSLSEAQDALYSFKAKEENLVEIAKAAEIMAETLKSGCKIISCGNGGSLCDASHFAEELTGRYRNNRQPFPAIAINDPAYITCTANDFSYEDIFSRYIEGVGQKGDVLLAISTSGNSANVVNAAIEAKKKGLAVVALTSVGKNKIKELADVSISAPKTAFADRIQEIHIKVIHILIQVIEQKLK
jgi:D-sedoheptulose 7-phosphate isomerase